MVDPGRTKRIDAAIKRAGIGSVSALAKLIGLSQPNLWEVTSGKRDGSATIAKIAEITGVHERWLQFGDDDVRPPWAIDQNTMAGLQDLTRRIHDGDPIEHQAKHDPQQAMLLVMRQVLAEIRALRSELAGISQPTPAPVAKQERPIFQAQVPAEEPVVHGSE